MSGPETIQPCGEKMRKTLRWVSEIVQSHPEKTRQQIIKEAEVRFDLSPKECCFLDNNFQGKP